METQRKTLALLDHCYPDYFTGYHKPVFAIPVYGTMTNAEVSEAIQDELNAMYDYFYGEHGYSKTEILVIDHFCEELNNVGNEIFVEEEESEDEDYEPNYLYFGIIKPAYRYGMMFLNK